MSGRYAVMLCPTPEYPRVIVADMTSGELWAQVEGKGLLDVMAAGKGQWLLDMPDLGVKLPYPEALVCMAPMSWLREYLPEGEREGLDAFTATCLTAARNMQGATLQ
jgi:hypothetical protein